MTRPALEAGPVTLEHLNREVVQADRQIAHYLQHCQWDLAQSWDEYRDRIQTWRYIALRHRRPLPVLEACPHCGHVQELTGNLGRCNLCAWQWTSTGRHL